MGLHRTKRSKKRGSWKSTDAMHACVVREARTVGLESLLIKHQAMRAMDSSSRVCRNTQRDHLWIATSFPLRRWSHPCPTSHLDTMKWSRLELLMRTNNGMKSFSVGVLLRAKHEKWKLCKQHRGMPGLLWSKSPKAPSSLPRLPQLYSSAAFRFLQLFEIKMERLSGVAWIMKQQVIWYGWAFLSMSCHPRITHCRRKHHPCIRSKVEERRRTWMGVGLWWKRKAASTTSPWDVNDRKRKDCRRNQRCFVPHLRTYGSNPVLHYSIHLQDTKLWSCGKLQSCV